MPWNSLVLISTPEASFSRHIRGTWLTCFLSVWILNCSMFLYAVRIVGARWAVLRSDFCPSLFGEGSSLKALLLLPSPPLPFPSPPPLSTFLLILLSHRPLSSSPLFIPSHPPLSSPPHILHSHPPLSSSPLILFSLNTLSSHLPFSSSPAPFSSSLLIFSSHPPSSANPKPSVAKAVVWAAARFGELAGLPRNWWEGTTGVPRGGSAQGTPRTRD